MLQYLRIKNLALMSEVTLEFPTGFTVVTGETGAGKSVLLGALSLLSGSRADKTIVRQGADQCEVEAALYLEDSREVEAVLQETGLPPCDNGALLLKRIIPRDKIPKITVNGSLTTLANLRRVGECWIDFHGPGEPQRLFSPECQLEMLDLYASLESVLEPYRSTYARWRALLAEKGALASKEALSEEEVQFIENQIAKIDQCEVSEEGIAELEERFNRVSKAQELILLAQNLAAGLGDDGGVLEQLAQLQRMGKDLVDTDPSSAPLAERLESLCVEVEDLGQEFGSLAAGFDIEPEEAEQVQQRMNSWLELQRRYGSSVEAVLEKRAELANRLESQQGIHERAARLEAESAKAEAELKDLAGSLRKGREKAAAELSKRVIEGLRALGFQKGGFSVKIVDEPNLTPHGDSRCEFLFAANAGQELLPLNKIASSGETARVMLAVKTILAEVDEIPVLVFDEVDANVGGEIGRIVGERLAALAGRHQVFCVTHLPQVASLGTNHYVVEKEQSRDATTVRIRAIHTDRQARLAELARMLGDRQAKSALAHAEELMKAK